MRIPATTATASIEPIVRNNTWIASRFMIGVLYPEENIIVATNETSTICPGFPIGICGTVKRCIIEGILIL